MCPGEVLRGLEGRAGGELEPGATLLRSSAHVGTQMGSCPSLVQPRLRYLQELLQGECLGQDKGMSVGV